MILTIAAALAVGTASVSPPVAATAAQSAPARREQCELRTAPQFGPRAPVTGSRWTCAAVPEPVRCGRYASYLPIWAVGRALPLERRWVAEPCRPTATE